MLLQIHVGKQLIIVWNVFAENLILCKILTFVLESLVQYNSQNDASYVFSVYSESISIKFLVSTICPTG